jgi:hypothetical protein
MQRLTPTGCKVITRSRSRTRTSINRLSLHSPSSSSTRRSSNNCPGYPRGRLSVVKHRQLARQVGVFGTIAIKSFMDFDNMIFPMGSIFIFGLWVCEADDNGNLQGRLMEALEACKGLTLPTKLTEVLAQRLTIFESTRAPTTTSLDLTSGLDSPSESYPCSFKDKPSPFLIGLQNAASILQNINSNLLQVSPRKLSHLSTKLNNVARAYQDLLQNTARPARRLRLTEAQEGLILTVTSKDCLVHWPGACPQDKNAQLVEEVVCSAMPTLQLKSSATTTRQAWCQAKKPS